MRRRKNMCDEVFFNWMIEQKTIDDNECWLWNRGKNSAGYGCVVFHSKMNLVHRLSFQYHSKTCISKDDDIRHVCPNTPNTLCFNPKHLLKGTRKENMEDMVHYGRSQKGEKNYHSKLSNDDVLCIRAQRDMFLLRELSEMYGVDQALISMIVNNKIWKHVN
jgi:hypothetical protein